MPLDCNFLVEDLGLLLLGTIATFVFLPLALIYVFRSSRAKKKRPAKILKGINYFIISILILLAAISVIPHPQLDFYLFVMLVLVGVVELSYHVDILIDIFSELIEKVRIWPKKHQH